MTLHLVPPQASEPPTDILDAMRAGLTAADESELQWRQVQEVAADVGRAACTAFGVECQGFVNGADELRVDFGTAGSVTIATLQRTHGVFPVDIIIDRRSTRCEDLAALKAAVIDAVGRAPVMAEMRRTANRSRVPIRAMSQTSTWNKLGGANA